MIAPSQAARFALPSALILALAACSPRAPVDPADQARNVKTDVPTRVAAVDDLWAAERARDHDAAREALKRLAWQAANPGPVRVRAIEILAADPDDHDQADTRNMLRLMLPIEPNMLVIESICSIAQRGGRRWADLTPALVRSYSRRTDPPPDPQRPERAALLALHPGKSIEQIAFDQFLAPIDPAGLTEPELDRAKKTKAGAWELLSRLDADGSRRAALLASTQAAGDPALDSLRAAAADLRCIPLTASQLEWLGDLRAFDHPSTGDAARRWWAEARDAVAALPADRLDGWALRHVEPLRWARTHRPDLLAMDRDALAASLRATFRGRPIVVRGDAERGGGELFADRAARLAWGDLLTIAIADGAVRESSVLAALAAQIARDRTDTTTEYGGVLAWSDTRGEWVATMYVPRAGQRRGDAEFVAPPEMLGEGARAAFHYHFHAQRDENRDYAGPGPGDLAFADFQGRACLVFTTIRKGVVNADYYSAGRGDRVVVDLGNLTLP